MGQRLHKKWGYDLDKVKHVNCMRCGKPIGKKSYVEDTAFARFGQMFFYHTTCLKKGEKIK